MGEKYYVGRRWPLSGREEFLTTRRFDRQATFCDAEHIKKYPGTVWQFSESEARKLVDKCNAPELDAYCEYFMIPVEKIF